MLKYFLLEETEDRVIYKYHPENKAQFGIVSFNKNTKECCVITLAKNDVYRRYALHMFSKMREFAKENSYRREGIVAWG